MVRLVSLGKIILDQMGILTALRQQMRFFLDVEVQPGTAISFRVDAVRMGDIRPVAELAFVPDTVVDFG